MAARNRLEESYLKHILTAVEVRDYSAPFRTFFDNWFAFREGGPFLNRNSRPHWYNNPCPDRDGHALRRAHFVSMAAARTLGGFGRTRLMRDHAVPVAVLRDMLFQAQPESTDDVEVFLMHHYRFGIITSEEDQKLIAAGLRSRMPDGWTAVCGLFARYEKAGIVAQDQDCLAQASSPPKLERIAHPARHSRLAELLNSTTSRSAWQGSSNNARG